VLAGGELREPQSLRLRLGGFPADLVIAADGGARHAATLGLSLDAVVGDLDSLSSQIVSDLARLGASIHRHPADKNEIDLELALLHAAAAGATEIVVVGATGARLDMTLANVMLLLHPGVRGTRVELWDGDQTGFVVVPPGGELPGAVGDTLSLIPLGGEARGVVTDGLAFPLHGETLAVGPARGVSNRIVRVGARLALDQGALLVVHTPRAGGGPH